MAVNRLLDDGAVRLRMGAADDVRDPATGVEQDVERVVEPGHRRDLVDVRAHRAGKRAVVRLRRGDEVAVVRLDRLVGTDARHDQLPAAAVAPVVCLRLADRDLHVALHDFAVHPDRRAARRDSEVRVDVRVAGLVLVQRDPEPFHPVEVLAPDLHLDVGLGKGKDLAVARDHARISDPGLLDRVEDGGKELRRGRGAELVVDDDRDTLLAGEQLGERRAGDGARERLACRGVGAADRLGLVRVDRGEQIRARNLQLELFAVDLALVVRGADRQRVERLKRDPEALGVGHLSSGGRSRRRRLRNVPRQPLV